MNMKFLSVVKPSPAIYRGFSIWETFWEEKFTPVNMKVCVRLNVRKHREINNDDKYIILDVSYKLYCMDKREVTYSEPNGYMVIPVKWITASLNLNIKRSRN